MNVEQEQNHALLVGMIAGMLSSAEAQRKDYYMHSALEVENGDYTGRILINRPSGTWVLTVAPLEEDEQGSSDTNVYDVPVYPDDPNCSTFRRRPVKREE